MTEVHTESKIDKRTLESTLEVGAGGGWRNEYDKSQHATAFVSKTNLSEHEDPRLSGNYETKCSTTMKNKNFSTPYLVKYRIKTLSFSHENKSSNFSTCNCKEIFELKYIDM